MIYSKAVNDFFLIYQRPVVCRKKKNKVQGKEYVNLTPF